MKAAAIVTGLTSVGLVLAGGPADASATPGSTGRVCWGDYSSGVTSCFDSTTQMLDAIRAATGHDLVYPANTQASASSTPAPTGPTGKVSPQAAYALATIYDDRNYGGGSYTFTDTHSTTCKDYFYNYNTMPSGWDNRVSSFKSFGGCKTRLSENTNQGGASVGPLVNSSYVGDTLNDRASSAYITG